MKPRFIILFMIYVTIINLRCKTYGTELPLLISDDLSNEA